MLLRGTAGICLVIAFYIGMTEFISNQLNKKIDETEDVIIDTQKQISKITDYSKLVDSRTTQYQDMVTALDEASSKISDDYSSKNAIPNLLNKIMYKIPKGVQLLSISNQSGKSVTITARAKEYDQLGYFKAVLEEEGILFNISTTRGEKQNDLINVTITGELPY